jgi:hypothetical protein
MFCAVEHTLIYSGLQSSLQDAMSLQEAMCQRCTANFMAVRGTLCWQQHRFTPVAVLEACQQYVPAGQTMCALPGRLFDVLPCDTLMTAPVFDSV